MFLGIQAEEKAQKKKTVFHQTWNWNIEKRPTA